MLTGEVLYGERQSSMNTRSNILTHKPAHTLPLALLPHEPPPLPDQASGHQPQYCWAGLALPRGAWDNGMDSHYHQKTFGR